MDYERDEGREGMGAGALPLAFNNVNGNTPYMVDPRTLRHRASTVPVGQSHNVSHLPYYPPFLAPGYRNGPQTVHKADIFFAQPSSSSLQQSSVTNVQRPSRYRTHHETHIVPYETHPHRSVTLPTSPPVPPKPIELAARIAPYPNLPLSSPPAAPATLSDLHALRSDDASTAPADSDLAVALALSESESNQQQEHLQKLAEQEEEELARALAASLVDSRPSTGTEELERALAESMQLVKSFANRSGDASISTSYPLPAVTLRDHNSLSELGSSAHELPGSSTNLSKAAIVSVHISSSRENLQGDGKDSQGQNEFELSYLSSGFSRVPATSLRSTDSIININKDSQHACNDQGLFDATGGLSYSSPHSLASMNNPSDENIVSVPLSDALAARRNLPSHTQTTDSPPNEEVASVSLSMPIIYPQLSNSAHSPAPSESVSISSTSFMATSVKESPNDDNASLLSKNSSPDSASSSASKRSVPSRNLSTTSSNMTTMNLNQFVDAELLFGVSIGFNPPTISTTQVPMQGALPNIISLPYGKAPPLHIQAPSWRQTLRLLARMSGSRMEPAVEAMAVTKSDMKLRTVVQFFKPHHTSSEWRTILWFTIDHPISPDMSNAYKYHGHSINSLPWSYTLSKTPDLLQDAADTALSKVYVIPATDAVPYPMLPITLPNLAIYLQAALDDSRKYVNDSSSGLRKLAKMVQMCYPTNNSDQIPEPTERTGMGGLFKRVMGRNNKANKTGRGGNEDTYELVTPFVPDEWG